VISSLSGHGKRPLTKPRGGGERRSDFSPTWSPDGSTVAFARWTPKQLSVMVVRSDGSGLHRVAALGRRRPPYSSDLAIRWSPDGARLAYAAWLPNGRPLREAIYVAAVDGSGSRRIALVPKNAYAFFSLFGWTPDGSRVTYALSGGEPLSLRYEGPSDLMTTSAGGTDTAKVLTEDEIDDASWLADGSLLYVRNCLLPSACQLALRPPESQTSRPLTHFKFPAWSGCCEWDGLPFMERPASGEIVYTHGRKVYDFSPTTDTTRTVRGFRCPRKRCLPLSTGVVLARISPDGRVALIEFYDLGNNFGLSREHDYRLDLETGALTRIHLVTTNPAQIHLS
jgi:dipeptidyl aminopeptidase/acylaminoacyl peptidase